MSPPARLILVVLLGVALVAWLRGTPPAAGGIAPEVRAAGLRFDPALAEADRGWVLAAIAAARPEAQALIAEVDGTVTIQGHRDQGQVIGWARSGPGGSVVSVDVHALNGERRQDREVVVLHELGHVVDHELVSDALLAELDAGIPRTVSCGEGLPPGACSAAEERFADTFAKWALRGSVSLAGSGYGIATPPSLEAWGQPLGRLAAELAAARG